MRKKQKNRRKKFERWEKASFIIGFVGNCLFLSLLIFLGVKGYLLSNELEQLRDFVMPEEKISAVHNGLLIYSDTETGLNKLKIYMNKLNVTLENYPDMLSIGFFSKENETCNGQYSFDNRIIVYACNTTQRLRDYVIPDKDFELYTLGHELGHYTFRHSFPTDEERWCDDFSHSISGVGIKYTSE